MKITYKTAILAAAFLGSTQLQAAPVLTNATFFNADATGNNISNSLGNPIIRGAWTTVLGAQNVPGNFGALLFLATSSNPSPASFLTPNPTNSITLIAGANKFYFWGNSDDPVGGAAGFGLNLFLNGAGPVNPTISAFATPTAGPAAIVNNASSCTAGSTFTCVAAAGTLVAGSVSLTDYQVFARGGGTGGEDRVNSDNVSLFAPPPHADGINDTYGSFTLFYNAPTGGVPEPASWALMIAGFGLTGAAMRRRAKVTVTYA